MKRAVQLIIKEPDQFVVTNPGEFPPIIETTVGDRIQLDLFNDEKINLTQTIQNVRDIGSIFTDNEPTNKHTT